MKFKEESKCKCIQSFVERRLQDDQRPGSKTSSKMTSNIFCRLQTVFLYKLEGIVKATRHARSSL